MTASYLQLPQDYIFFGNGAADVLFRLALALKPGRALLLAPTFADYEKALRTVDCKISYYNLQEARDLLLTIMILSMRLRPIQIWLLSVIPIILPAS